MEFNEKLQQLRKQKGLTQEELSEALYVSRTAVSKWESGRGFPNIESLKAISKYFSVSLDDLLSGDEILAIAEKDHKERECIVRDLVFGLLDCGMALLLFLPFFGQNANGLFQSVSLFALTSIQPYLRVIYFIDVIVSVTMGMLVLAMQNCCQLIWLRNKHIVSVVLSTVSVGLFIISQQPYAAVFSFVFLMIKAFMMIKQR